jgi:hypothetical protein
MAAHFATRVPPPPPFRSAGFPRLAGAIRRSLSKFERPFSHDARDARGRVSGPRGKIKSRDSGHLDTG